MNIKIKMHELKKELLLQEASGQFEEVGYEHMKVADLAKVAGVSIGTIYTLFGSKEGLYLSYIEYQINAFFEELQKNIVSDKDAKQRICTYVELKFSYYHQKRKAIGQSASNNPLFFNTLYSEHSKALRKIFKYLSECFMELNPKLDEDQAMRMAFALNGFSDGYISRWLEVGDELMDRVNEVCDLFADMVEGYQ